MRSLLTVASAAITLLVLCPCPQFAGDKDPSSKIKQFENEQNKVEELFRKVAAEEFKGVATTTYLLVNAKKEVRLEVNLYLKQKHEKGAKYIHLFWEIPLHGDFERQKILKITNDLNNSDFFANITLEKGKVKDNYALLLQQIAPKGKVDTKLMTLYLDRAARSYARTKKRLEEEKK